MGEPARGEAPHARGAAVEAHPQGQCPQHEASGRDIRSAEDALLVRAVVATNLREFCEGSVRPTNIGDLSAHRTAEMWVGEGR